MQASSFVEPEDDDFEVKVAPEPTNAGRGKKRKSEDMQEEQKTTTLGNSEDSSNKSQAKKRFTRTRASSVQPENVVALAMPEAHDEDTHMTIAETMPPPPPPPVWKKGGKGGQKRGSSNVRKASATSTASMASLRATVPDDDDIEAALEADLDRPLTDDEADVEPPPTVLPRTRRLTRTKPASRNGAASTAPTRRTTRTSTVTTENAELEPEQEPEVEPKFKAAKSGKARKAPCKQAETSHTNADSGVENVPGQVEEPQEQGKEEMTESKGPERRQVSQQAAARKTRASEISSAASVEYPKLDLTSSALNSSILGSRTAEDDSGHDTDASIASPGQKKRGPKKGTGMGKKAKAGKKAGVMSRNIEDIVQPETIVEVVIQRPEPLKAEVVDKPAEVLENETVDIAEPKKGSKKKTSKSTKAKTTKAKAVAVPSSPPPSQMSEPWTDQPLGESTPLQSAKADIPTFTPIEAAQIAPPPHAATPEKKAFPGLISAQKTPRLAASPQSSDAENQPPSSRPSALRPPLEMQSPSKLQTIRVPLAASTPTASPSRRNISRLQTSMPWTAVEFAKFFQASPDADKENVAEALKGELTSSEKKLTVEEWIYHNAKKGEEKLRNECERLVGRFEGEGVRALKTLEGIRCAE